MREDGKKPRAGLCVFLCVEIPVLADGKSFIVLAFLEPQRDTSLYFGLSASVNSSLITSYVCFLKSRLSRARRTPPRAAPRRSAPGVGVTPCVPLTQSLCQGKYESIEEIWNPMEDPDGSTNAQGNSQNI